MHETSEFLPQKCMSKMFFFVSSSRLSFGWPKLRTSNESCPTAAPHPTQQPRPLSVYVSPPRWALPASELPTAPFTCRRMQLICFYASGGGLKDQKQSKTTRPLKERLHASTPSLWGHRPPPATNPSPHLTSPLPVKKRALHFKQKKHPTPSSPLAENPPFLPPAIVFVASWPSFKLRQLQRRQRGAGWQRGRGVGRGGERFKWIAVALCVSFSVIVYFSFCAKRRRRRRRRRTKSVP